MLFGRVLLEKEPIKMDLNFLNLFLFPDLNFTCNLAHTPTSFLQGPGM